MLQIFDVFFQPSYFREYLFLLQFHTNTLHTKNFLIWSCGTVLFVLALMNVAQFEIK